MNSLAHLLILIAMLVGFAWWIWRSTDSDPKRFRAQLDEQEVQASKKCEPWAATEIERLAKAAGLNRTPSFRIANSGAGYSWVRHQIQVSRAMLARLSANDLRLILAHEVGHAVQGFRWIGSEKDEADADRLAMRITGLTSEQWADAALASMRAEPAHNTSHARTQLARRAAALGVELPA